MGLRDRGEKKHFEFKVIPGSLKEEHTQIRAVLNLGGKSYSEGYTFVTREDLASAYYYQPAVQRVSIVDVKAPKHLTVAYIPGAGDEIPTVLQQIGIDVTVLPAEKLTSQDLSRNTERSFSASALMTPRRMSRPTTRNCWTTFRQAAR